MTTSQARILSNRSCWLILDALHRGGPMTSRAIREATGLSVGELASGTQKLALRGMVAHEGYATQHYDERGTTAKVRVWSAVYPQADMPESPESRGNAPTGHEAPSDDAEPV